MKKTLLSIFFCLLILVGCDSQPLEDVGQADTFSVPFTQPYAEYHEEAHELLNEEDISNGCVEGYNEGYYHALIGEEPSYYEMTEEKMELSAGAADGYFTEDDFWSYYVVSYHEGYQDSLAGIAPKYGAEHGEDIDEISDVPPEDSIPELELPASTTGTDTQSVTVYVTDTGYCYHTANCYHLNKSKNAISLSAAIGQGYEPCSHCHPPQ